ncbi:hypothetical protein COB52_03035 [Candidatus Kaiserbacteria bacterium]|nr:MAG: hypothetical protein COB52_03035 [Candidatus Kaiserbacteria bacterium]
MKILVLSNMSAKPSAPMQGLFVDNQVASLKAANDNIDYYKIKWNTDSLFCKLFKYPVFILHFLWDIVIKREKYALIHVHFYFPTIILAFLYKSLKNKHVKVIVTCHGTDVYSYSPPSYLYKRLSKIVDFWIFTSEELRSRFFKQVDSSTVLCAGYDDKVFNLPTENARENKVYDFLQIGTLNKNKGLDRFLYLVSKMPHLRFAIVGEGPLKEEVLNAAKIYPNLEYLANQRPNNLSSIIQKSKFLLSLSRNESFGLTITEGHSCGVPCIATVTDGSQAQIFNNDFLIEQEGITETAIRDSLQVVLEKMSALDKNSYQEIVELVSASTKTYSLSYVTEQIKSIYEHELKDSK